VASGRRAQDWDAVLAAQRAELHDYIEIAVVARALYAGEPLSGHEAAV
jgi:hypothetical protein